MTDPDMKQIIGDVMATSYAQAGTQELIDTVVETMGKTHAAILPNHGGLFTGPSLDVVFAIAEAVESRSRNLLGFTS
jgi:ribulose-5-phosphate 4-epimerase/fuculose-1-phosphate aldolase